MWGKTHTAHYARVGHAWDAQVRRSTEVAFGPEHAVLAGCGMAASAPPSLPPGDRDSLTSLFSTLFATFGVIAIGYASKRTGYFSREAKAGLGDFVGKVALPALLFRAIATLQLSDLKAEFILGVFLAKTTLFVVTIGTAKMAGRGLADAAMWGLFVSNSNDLAQGYPLFLVLYPSYAYQLFITSAMQASQSVSQSLPHSNQRSTRSLHTLIFCTSVRWNLCIL